MSMFNILVWNVQGAASYGFQNALSSFLRIHNPVVVVLVEPRIIGIQADHVITSMKFDRSFRVEAEGFMGCLE